MMTELQRAALGQMLGEQLTTAPIDNSRACIAIRAGREMGCEREVVEMVKSKRAGFRTWRTLQQRRWQAGTRNPNKARHHDSIQIREQYVRI